MNVTRPAPNALSRLLALPRSEHAALTWRGSQMSYAELDDAIGPLVALLAEHGVARCNVLVYGPLCPGYVTALVACLRSGAVPVPVEAGMTPSQYAWVTAATRPSLALSTDVSTVEHCHGTAGPSEVVLDAATGRVIVAQLWARSEHWSYADPDAGYLIPTSGSTGAPKAIVGSRVGLYTFLAWFVDEFGLREEDVCAALTRVSFDPSLREILGVLTVGGRLALPDIAAQLDLRALARHLAADTPTMAFLVPSIARRVADVLAADGTELGELRLVFFAGEPLPSRVIRSWRAVAPGAELVNLYGMTEGTLAQVFRRSVEAPTGEPVPSFPVGRPRPGVSVSIDMPDADGWGEVLIESAAPALGVLATIPADESGVLSVTPISSPLRTGDLGVWDERGELVIAGRIGNDFKLSGRRVSYEPFVAGVEELPGVVQCVVVERDGAHAFIAGGDVGTRDEAALRERVHAVVQRVGLPRLLVHVRSELPLLRSGKVDRVALAASVAAGADAEAVVPVVGDRTLEHELLELLGLGDVAATETSFVDAGLTSLDVMDLIVELERRWGVALSVHECFAHRNVASLARAIEAGSARTPGTEAPLATDASRAADDAVQTLDAVPLSTRQVAYMATCMTDGNANWCNISREVEIDRLVDVDEVRAAVCMLVARHDVLRLALAPDSSRLVHAAADALSCPVTVHHGSAHDRDDPLHRARVQEARVAAVSPLIDPTRAPVIRVGVVPGRGTTSVLLVAHHLFVDGLSLDLLATELHDALEGQTPAAPVPPDVYRRYCLATRRASDERSAAAAYWDALLAGAGQTQLPERGGPGSASGDLMSRPFGVRGARTAYELAATLGVSVFAVVLAAFERAVTHSFGLVRPAIVVPVQVRDDVRAGAVGMFMSQLVVRVRKDAPLRDAAGELARQLDQGAASSVWEFDQRVDALGLKGSDGFPLSTLLFNQHPKSRGLRPRELGQWQPRALGRALRYQLQGELQMSGTEMVLSYYYRRGIAEDAAGTVDRLHGRVLAELISAERTLYA